MPCPSCWSSQTQEQPKQTSVGYRTFRYSACRRRFNERGGTRFSDLSVRADIVFLVVLWQLPSPLSWRQLAEMFLERVFLQPLDDGVWESLVAPLLTEYLGGQARVARG